MPDGVHMPSGAFYSLATKNVIMLSKSDDGVYSGVHYHNTIVNNIASYIKHQRNQSIQFDIAIISRYNDYGVGNEVLKPWVH